MTDMTNRPQHIVVEGLPAVGKSELLALIERFYSDQAVVLPEMVKEVVLRDGLDLFTDRSALAAALLAELPRRRQAIEMALAAGKLCLEESHMGVHLAYCRALSDPSLDGHLDELERAAPMADLYLRLEAAEAVSVFRQRARGTPDFEVEEPTLRKMTQFLASWHAGRPTRVVSVDADRSAHEVVAEVVDLLGLQYRGVAMPNDDVFPVVLLLGRPASGKSELIDYMQRTPLAVRRSRYRLGTLRVVDDFPILWRKFIEDDLWEKTGRRRLYSRAEVGNYSVTDDGIWSFLIERLNEEVEPLLAARRPGKTLVIEFSRGGKRGYADALERLSTAVLDRAAILYVDVPFEESWRRNLARYDVARRDGILTHSVPRKEIERTYGDDDWHELAREGAGRIRVAGREIPYVTMNNVPELTDPRGLDTRYREALERLRRAAS